MFSFFIPKDRWKWDPAKGVPDKKVIKLQRQTLRSGNDEVKKRLLAHVADLADTSVELQSALCNGKVTAEVCACFLSGSVTVQQAAAETLTALCDGHPGNCAAVVAARYSTLLGSPQQPLPHAIKLLLAERNLELALSAAGLLEALAGPESAAVVSQLAQPGVLGKLLPQLRAWSRAALTSGTPPVACARLLRLLVLLLGVLQCAASAGGAAMCRELFKAGVMALLLELAREHRGQRDPLMQQQPTSSGGAAGDDEGGGCGAHLAVVRDALNLLFVMLSQVPAHRLKLQEADGVQQLLAVLRDLKCAWSVRLQAVAALTAAASSPAVAEDVRTRGLGLVVPLLSSLVRGRDSQGGSTTPQRTAAPAGPASPSAASPPLSPADSLLGSPFRCSTPAAAAAAAGGPEPEPRSEVVVESLLGLLDAVAGATDCPELLEEGLLAVITAALNSGLASFSAGGYRMATAAAQVLFRLASRPEAALPPALSGPVVTGPLAKLVSRAQDYAAAASGKDAQVLHGAWCAQGLLCRVMDSDRRCSDSQAAAVVSSGHLQQGVRLLDVSAPVLLVAVGAAPPPYAVPAAVVWQTPGVQPAEGLRPDGRAYLAKERVASDLRSAVPLLLQLLGDLAQRSSHQPALRELGVVEAARALLPWRQVQWRVKRLLCLLGELEVEYKPFTAYGCGPLLAAVLASQGLEPGPFLTGRVDAHLLLRLEDSHLRSRMGLDDVDVLKVARLRDAYALFSAIDAVDGRVDGCVTSADMERYLTTIGSLRQKEAQELSEATFRQMQVLPGEPSNFIQFLQVYPSLEGELEAVMPRRPAGRRAHEGGGGASGGLADAFNYGGGAGGSGAPATAPGGAFGAGEGGAARAWKRQRVGGHGASATVIDLE